MPKYRELIYNIITHFNGIAAFRHGGSQFAVICLIPKGKGSKSYSAETPEYGKKIHAEILLLDKLDRQYEDFYKEHGTPKALILYTWIVPCTDCTKAIISKLKSPRFANIPDKVVAYTTRGTRVRKCNEAVSKKAFSATDMSFCHCKYYHKYRHKY